jgi:hypothetical protein
MQDEPAIKTLLRRIEENQLKALQLHEQQLSFAKAQLERSEQRIAESMQLQRLSIARQTQIRNVAFPLIAVLLILVGYLLLKLRIF